MTSSSPKQSKRPVLIYDGRCGFCRIWVDYWRLLTGERVEFAASQEVAEQYSKHFKRTIRQIRLAGPPRRKTCERGRSRFRIDGLCTRQSLALVDVLQRAGIRDIVELAYGFIAAHRNFASGNPSAGEKSSSRSHALTRSLFLRGMGIVYLVAFLALAPQIIGLVGEHGILPVQTYSDSTLLGMCWSGAALALALIVGVVPVPATIGLYVLYLLVDLAGQDFLSFQWDALLLEAGFAAILLAPFGIRPSYSRQLSKFALWVRPLIFRLMLESGFVKWQSGIQRGVI